MSAGMGRRERGHQPGSAPGAADAPPTPTVSGGARTRRAWLQGIAGSSALLGAATVGCGRGATEGAPSGGAKAPVTLEIIQDPQSPLIQEAWPKIWQNFQAAHPGLTVNYDMPVWGTIQEKILTLAASNSLPDVTYIHTQFLPDWHAAGVLRDLNPLMARDKAVKPEDFFPGVLAFFQPAGTTRGLPFFSGPAMLFYNKSLFQRYGLTDPNQYEKEGKWTWETFLELSRQLTRGEGQGKTFGYQGTNSQLVWHAMWVWMNGGELWDKAETTFLMHEAPAAEAIQFQIDLVTRHRVQPNAEENASLTGGFLAGRSGMYLFGKGYATNISGMKDLEAGICPVPKGKQGRVCRDGPGAVGVTSQSRHPDEAFQLVKYMTGPGGQEQFLALGASVPVRKSLSTAKEYLNALLPWEDRAVYEDASKSVRPIVYPPGFGEIEKAWQAARTEMLEGRAAARDALLAIKPGVDGVLGAAKR
ncbi:MAG TPA: sugar ABC transporter substrate-binding protein [Chloroflexota bacterium]|nr:sugar ABC transporter substrate-binding protein [Chloroflexota bacterium]